MAATRASVSDPFGGPRVLSSLTGFVEAPTISLDRKEMFYHRKVGTNSEARCTVAILISSIAGMRTLLAACAGALLVCSVSAAKDRVLPPEDAARAKLLAAQLRRKQALDRAYALGHRFQQFSDQIIGARAVAALAETVCPYNRTYAQTMFTDAMNTLTIAANVSDQDRAQARLQVLASATACDRTLAERLSPWRRRANPDAELRRAISMLDAGDVQDAVDVTGAAVFGPLSSQGNRTFVNVLMQLHDRGEAETADNLFLARVAWVDTQPAYDTEDYARLGGYLFDTELLSRDGTLPQPAQAAPDTSSELVRAYAETALTLLEQRVEGLQQKQVQYAFAQALLPAVRAFEPDLEPELANDIQQLGGAVGRAFEYEVRRALAPAPRSEAEEIRRAGGDPVGEDKARVRVLLRHWSPGETARMRDLASGINDSTVKMKLDALITFAEAAKDDRSATRLRPSTKSALYWLSRNDVARAVHDVPYADIDLRPFLLLAAADLTALQPDNERRTYAWHLLRSAVDAFNDAWNADSAAVDAGDLPSSEEMSDWNEIVQTGDTDHPFPLRSIVSVSGLDLKSALPPLVAMSADRVEETLVDLEDEWLQAQSLIDVTGERLANAFGRPPARRR